MASNPFAARLAELDADEGGMTEPGNIDLAHRPRVKNPDGSVSTVRSIGVNIDGQETLIPTVSDDGRIMSDDEAVATYKRTGRHLGKYKSVAASNAAGAQIHEDQAAGRVSNPFAARLAEMDAGPPQIDARGHEYDPRFAPEQFKNQTGSYESVMEHFRGGAKPQPVPSPGKAEAFRRGAAQGITLGFGDEVKAGVDTGAAKISEALGGGDFAQNFARAGSALLMGPLYASEYLKGKKTQGTYTQRREQERAADIQAREAEPIAYGGGELAGGIALTPVMPGGAGVAGAIRSGAMVGAATGLGSSTADLSGVDEFQRNWKQAATDAAKSGVIGGATAGVLTGIGQTIVKNAPKNARGWVVADIIGDARGASTPTARKQLADDAVNASKIVRSDKPLDKAIDAARHGSVDEVQAAKEVIHERLQSSGTKLSPGWKEVDKALDEPLTSGRVLNHLDERIEGLRASGHTTDAAEADALQGIATRLRSAKDWGAEKAAFNPKHKIQGGPLDGMEAGQAVKLLKKQRDILTREPQKVLAPTPEVPKTPLSRIPTAAEQRPIPVMKTSGPGALPVDARQFRLAEGAPPPPAIPKGASPDFAAAGQAELDALRSESRYVMGPEGGKFEPGIAEREFITDAFGGRWVPKTPAGAAVGPKWVPPTELPAMEAARRAQTRAYAASKIGARGRASREGARYKAFGAGNEEVAAARPHKEVVKRAVSDIDETIQRITDQASTKGFDPDHKIGAEQLQKLWSDEAGIAYQSQGGVNGTATFNRKLDVASHLRDLREEILDAAEAKAPGAVAKLRDELRHYSALKRMEQVMDQRLNSAKAKAGGTIPDWILKLGKGFGAYGGLGGSAMALAHGNIPLAAALAAPSVYVAGKRALDRGVAGLVEKSPNSVVAREIVRLIQSGVPRATAIRMATSASQGGLIDRATAPFVNRIFTPDDQAMAQE